MGRNNALWSSAVLGPKGDDCAKECDSPSPHSVLIVASSISFLLALASPSHLAAAFAHLGHALSSPQRIALLLSFLYSPLLPLFTSLSVSLSLIAHTLSSSFRSHPPNFDTFRRRTDVLIREPCVAQSIEISCAAQWIDISCAAQWIDISCAVQWIDISIQLRHHSKSPFT